MGYGLLSVCSACCFFVLRLRKNRTMKKLTGTQMAMTGSSAMILCSPIYRKNVSSVVCSR